MINKQAWLDKIKQEKHLSMPVLTFPAVQMLGISVNELVNSAHLQAESMSLIAKKYPISAALSMMDLSVEAEEFGSPVRYFDMDIPTVTDSIIKSSKDAFSLQVPSLGNKRTLLYVEGVKEAKTLIKDIPVLAGVIGPFSLSGRLMDMTEVMVNCYMDPEMVHETLKKASEFITKYILAFKEAGADGVIMAEPAAGLLSPKICEEFSSKYIKEIVNQVSDDSFIFVYHNCGNVVPLADTILSIHADIYHFGDAIDIEDILKVFPKDKLVMGNISPSHVFRKLKPKKVAEETEKLLSRCDKYDNFLISSGCDIPPLTPLENIDAYFQAINKHYNIN